MYGVIVVPTTATISSRVAGSSDSDGVTRASATGRQSGVAMMAAIGYARNTSITRRKTRSTSRYGANSTRLQIAMATTGTVSHFGTPNRSSAAAAPARFAIVLAMFATSRTAIANTVQRTPK